MKSILLRLLLFSDLHVHPYRDFSTMLANGRNSRLEDTLEVLRRIRAYCIANAILTVFFGGDLFHKRRILNVAMFNAVYDELALFKEAGITVIIIPGNHDQATRDGSVHSIHALAPVCALVDTPKVIKFMYNQGVELAVNCVPYQDDVEAYKKAFKVKPGGTHNLLLAHAGVFGATSGPYEYVPMEVLRAEDIPMENYDHAFFGHYHKQQMIRDNCWYIGSPLQHTRGDVGDDKGFIVYDVRAKTWENVPLGLPKFVKLTEKDIHKKSPRHWDVYGNFVDCVLDNEPEGGVESFKDLLIQLGAKAANVVCTAAKERDPAMKRVDVDPSLSFDQLVSKYVEEYGREGLDPQKLKRMAKDYLEKAEET